MSAALVLAAARRQGIRLTVDHDRLQWESDVLPDAEMFAALEKHKDTLVSLIGSDTSAANTETVTISCVAAEVNVTIHRDAAGRITDVLCDARDSIRREAAATIQNWLSRDISLEDQRLIALATAELLAGL